jgi:hypothetical protein
MCSAFRNNRREKERGLLDPRCARSLFSQRRPQEEQGCSALGNNQREKERGLLITIERVPYFCNAGRRRNKVVPLSEIIG